MVAASQHYEDSGRDLNAEQLEFRHTILTKMESAIAKRMHLLIGIERTQAVQLRRFCLLGLAKLLKAESLQSKAEADGLRAEMENYVGGEESEPGRVEEITKRLGEIVMGACELRIMNESLQQTSAELDDNAQATEA